MVPTQPNDARKSKPLTVTCWKAIVLGFALTLAWGAGAQAQTQARGGSANTKIGFSRVTLAGPTYTLKEDATSTTTENSDNMTGNGLFVEYLFFGRIGLEFNLGIPELTRTYELETGGTTISNVTETAQAILLGLNLYFNSHDTPGVKPFFGLGAGRLSVDHEFSGGSLGSQSSSQTLQLNVLKIGLDWIKDNSGLRAEVFSWTGQNSDTAAIQGHTQTIDYTATGFSIGVFVFF